MPVLLLQALQGEITERIPFWLMRQAGRYLPEYRTLRKETEDFLSFCYTPERAAEATLQPIARFGMDAAILFSDILVIADALGQSVCFMPEQGPVLEPLRSMEDIEALRVNDMQVSAHLAPVCETVRRIRAGLDANRALIGFCGAPWTVACYMLEGSGSGKDFTQARRFAYEQPEAFARLLDIILQASVIYLLDQIRAGAQAVQIFDSWAGLAPAEKFDAWVIRPTCDMVERLREFYPDIPVIGFPRGGGVQIARYAQETGVQAVGLDQGVPLEWAAVEIPAKVTLQGNLDNVLLASDQDGAIAETRRILGAFKRRAAVFNLGHGVLPWTPVAHVEVLSRCVKEWKR